MQELFETDSDLMIMSTVAIVWVSFIECPLAVIIRLIFDLHRWLSSLNMIYFPPRARAASIQL